MPKTADPAVRMALLEEAARLTAEEGRQALTLRRLAAAVGTSTMAVYTHFGSMEELRGAVRREGFSRLAVYLDAVDRSDDPVADLIALGWAYYRNATTNPNLYRAMFLDGPCDDDDIGVGWDTFERLVAGVQRVIDAGRFDPADATGLATQLWSATHGVVSLQLARMLPGGSAVDCMLALVRNLFRSFGDSPADLEASLVAARPRLVPRSAADSRGRRG